FLGSIVDGDTNGQPNATATGDDLVFAPNDEDGVTFGTLRQGRNTTVTVVASAAGKLDAFVDFNADGDFCDPDEKIFDNLTVAAGTNSLTFRSPSTAADSNTFARFRISTAGGLTFSGLASDGEVEDYAVRIRQGTDLGDAPDSYATTLASDGARHLLGSTLFLGAVVDGNQDGEPNATALGDDNNYAPDDEDGVTFGTLTVGDSMATVDVTASAMGKLDAFADFNLDGDFADVGEKIFNNVSVTAGVNMLTFAIPPGATAGQTYFRFRVSTAGGLSFNGLANDGEVEDYRVNVAAAQLLMAEGGERINSSAAALTQSQLLPIIDAAIARYAAQGLDARQLAALGSVSFAIADLPGAMLGLAAGRTITLDATAAGYGWFVNSGEQRAESREPADSDADAGSSLLALRSSHRMDLLTAVMHELGHTLGHADLDPASHADELMSATLAAGVRQASHIDAVDAVFAGQGVTY
ncbi:MAG: GEVED domain-containing protein, partial [Betaproteobacteria bacterium]